MRECGRSDEGARTPGSPDHDGEAYGAFVTSHPSPNKGGGSHHEWPCCLICGGGTDVSNCQTHQTLRGPPTLATSGMSGVHAPFVHPSATPPPFLTAPTLPPFTLLPAFPQVHRRPMLARCAHLRHIKAPAVCVLHELDPQPQLQPHLPGGGKEVKDVVCCMQTGYIMHADWAY